MQPCLLYTSDEDMQNNPRATVQQVYDQIMSDLNTAADLLEMCIRDRH